MSEFDLSSSIESARRAVAQASERYVAAQEALEAVAGELTTGQQKLRRLEKALAILNGEEEPASTAAPSVLQPAATAAPPVAPALPPPPPRPAPTGFAALTCSACGTQGKLNELYRPTKNGTMVHLLVCGDCNNEVYVG